MKKVTGQQIIEVGDKVEILDGFARIGEVHEVVAVSEFTPISYKLSCGDWWLHSQIKKI